jgi:hypothetical protein
MAPALGRYAAKTVDSKEFSQVNLLDFMDVVDSDRGQAIVNTGFVDSGRQQCLWK